MGVEARARMSSSPFSWAPEWGTAPELPEFWLLELLQCVCGGESLDGQWWFERLGNSCNTRNSEALEERLNVAKSLEN